VEGYLAGTRRTLRQDPGYKLAGLSYKEMREELPSLLSGITTERSASRKSFRASRILPAKNPATRTSSLTWARCRGALVISAASSKNHKPFRGDSRRKSPEVKGNFQRLEQVVINLIENACEANEDAAKPITVTISLAAGNHKVSVPYETRDRASSRRI